MNPRDRLSELVKEAEEKDLTNVHGKALPYLGWWWRDIKERGVQISWHDSQLWIDVARKWTYPNTRVTNERVEEEDDYHYEPADCDAMCEDLCEVLQDVISEGSLSRDHEGRFQEIIYEYAGNIPVLWYRCNHCDYENQEYMRVEGFDLQDHLEEEHDDVIESNDSDQLLIQRGEDYDSFVHHQICTDPNGATGVRMEPEE